MILLKYNLFYQLFLYHISSLITGISCDSRYVNNTFIEHFKSEFGQLHSNSDFHLPVSWDAAHYLNLAITDIRDGKKNYSQTVKAFFQRFISRSNLFSTIFGRGKNFSFLTAVANKRNLSQKCQRKFSATKLFERRYFSHECQKNFMRCRNFISSNTSEKVSWELVRSFAMKMICFTFLW